MSRNWTIRLAAALTILALSVPSAHAQFFGRPFLYEPFFPGNFYGGYPYGGMGYPGFGGGFGYPMTYNAGVYTPSIYTGNGSYYGGWAGYSMPILLGSATSEGRSSYSPAVAVAQDSPLLLAGYDAPTNDNRCVVVVVVPDANAQVWFQGSLTTLTGRVRRFTTPSLTPNKRYEYDVYVQWNGIDGVHSETRTVDVQSGGVVNVLFANPTPKTK